MALRGEIEGFRVRKEMLKARHGAAEASARAAEAFTGVGGEMADVNRAIERATERTEQMEARAAALEELEESGALDNILAEGDDIDRELEQRSSEQRVEMELEEVRRQLGRESEERLEETA
jgi:phage shock protein A